MCQNDNIFLCFQLLDTFVKLKTSDVELKLPLLYFYRECPISLDIKNKISNVTEKSNDDSVFVQCVCVSMQSVFAHIILDTPTAVCLLQFLFPRQSADLSLPPSLLNYRKTKVLIIYSLLTHICIYYLSSAHCELAHTKPPLYSWGMLSQKANMC